MNDITQGKRASEVESMKPMPALKRPADPLMEWKTKNRARGETRRSFPYRILLVDGSETFVSGLYQAVQKKDKDVLIQVACTAGEVQAKSFDLKADVAVIDWDLPDQSGFELCLWLTREKPGLSVLVLSQQHWDVIFATAWRVKSRGVLFRSDPIDKLVKEIFRVSYSPVFPADQQHEAQQWMNGVGIKLAALGKREWELLGLLANGMNSHEVAGSLQVTENTVEKHITSILRKLELSSRASLVSFYFMQHLYVLARIHDATNLFG